MLCGPPGSGKTHYIMHETMKQDRFRFLSVTVAVATTHQFDLMAPNFGSKNVKTVAALVLRGKVLYGVVYIPEAAQNLGSTMEKLLSLCKHAHVMYDFDPHQQAAVCGQQGQIACLHACTCMAFHECPRFLARDKAAEYVYLTKNYRLKGDALQIIQEVQAQGEWKGAFEHFIADRLVDEKDVPGGVVRTSASWKTIRRFTSKYYKTNNIAYDEGTCLAENAPCRVKVNKYDPSRQDYTYRNGTEAVCTTIKIPTEKAAGYVEVEIPSPDLEVDGLACNAAEVASYKLPYPLDGSCPAVPSYICTTYQLQGETVDGTLVVYLDGHWRADALYVACTRTDSVLFVCEKLPAFFAAMHAWEPSRGGFSDKAVHFNAGCRERAERDALLARKRKARE